MALFDEVEAQSVNERKASDGWTYDKDWGICNFA